MKTKIPLFGSGTQAKAIQLNPQKIINLYPVTSFNSNGQKSSNALYKRLGTDLFVTLANMGKIRGLLEYNNQLFVVSGNTFYIVGPEGNANALGTLTSSVGSVKIINNGLQIMTDDGYHGYTYTFSTSTFAQISDGDYISSGFITYQAGRAIYAKPNTNQFYISNLLDFTAYDAANYATAETIPQNLVCAYAGQSDLFLFGEKLTEIWALTGDALFPYEKRVGLNIPYGCAAKFSIADANGTQIWLAKNDQGKALLLSLNGYVPQIVLDEHDCYQFNQLTNLTDAIAYVFQNNGHLFYVISFPTDNKTFVLDLANKQLVEWSSWYTNSTDNAGNPIYVNGRFLGEQYVFFNNQHLVSDYRGAGRILVMSDSIVTDYSCGPDNSIYWEVISPIVSKNDTYIRLDAITTDMAKGVSETLQDSSTNNPLINVSLSKDGGNSFGTPRQHSYGFGGDYKQRVKMNLWGQFRDGAIKVFGNHSSFVALIDLILNVTLSPDQMAQK